jgi:hypothetical protein
MQTVEQKERVFSMSLPWPDQLTMTHLLTWLLRILTRTRTLTQEPNNQSRERSILTRSPVMLLLMSLALDLLKISDCTPED